MNVAKSYIEHRGYNPGHPWYYKLGGKVLRPKQILAAVKLSGYQGYKADDIQKVDNKTEPERSAVLRAIRQEAIKSLTFDLARYRELACELRDYRLIDEADRAEELGCAEVHTSLSLKHNHIYNDFAHLVVIDDLLSRQPDLFDF